MIKRVFIFLLFLYNGSLFTEAPSKQHEIYETIIRDYENLGTSIQKLKSRLNQNKVSNRFLLIRSIQHLSDTWKQTLDEALLAYDKKDYAQAKRLLYSLWEVFPKDAALTYNLGVIYYQLDNSELAKKMFKDSLLMDNKFIYKETINTFLSESTVKNKEQTASVDNPVRAQLMSDKNEIESLMRSKVLSFPEKMEISTALLQAMEKRLKDNRELSRDFSFFIGETYAGFELYEKSLEAFRQYEQMMEGHVISKKYYTKLLEIESKYKKQQAILQQYTSTQLKNKLAIKIAKDKQELRIFATQMEEFINKTQRDNDFINFCKRLKDYRWAGKGNKHVIIVNKYQKLMYSSLPGTLPIGRYQDTQGNKFLKNITLLADTAKFKEVYSLPVELSVVNKTIPYLLMYTYIPKHECFIIVRFPERDLL